MQDDTLEFFNRLSGRLKIELTEPAVQVAPNLLNKAAPAHARVTEVSFTLDVYEDDEFRALTDDEWSRVVIRASRIRMANLRTADFVVEHDAPDGAAFTVRDLRDAIAKTERESRDRSEWLGGIDVHHVFFEGITFQRDAWYIAWGS
jgi:hypothetical protein